MAPCNGDPIILRKENGQRLLRNAAWGNRQIVSSCSGNEIIVRLGDQVDTSKPIKSYHFQDDIFKGISDFCWPNFVNRKPDLSCFDASRTRNQITATNNKRQYVRRYSDNNCGTECPIWGIRCRSPYFRSGCAVSRGGQPPVGLVGYRQINNGCASDVEEWQNSYTLQMSCCRFRTSRND